MQLCKGQNVTYFFKENAKSIALAVVAGCLEKRNFGFQLKFELKHKSGSNPPI